MLMYINKQKKVIISKVILIITFTSALISLLTGIWEYVLPMYLMYKYNSNVNGTLGIIGGADGPTAVFVSYRVSSDFPITAIFFLITILGVIALFCIKRLRT